MGYRDHDGRDGRDDAGRAVPEKRINAPAASAPPERRPDHRVPARQRGFCPSRRLRHASEIPDAGDDPVNDGDPSGLGWSWTTRSQTSLRHGATPPASYGTTGQSPMSVPALVLSATTPMREQSISVTEF